MTLDLDTLEELGHGNAWEQLAIRWPFFVVARRASNAECERRARAAGRRVDLRRRKRSPEQKAREAAQKRDKRAKAA